MSDVIYLQVLTRIIDGKDYSFIEDNNLTSKMFDAYSDVFDFIVNHYNQYKVIPDDTTVQQKFPELTFVEVTESDAYLLDKLKQDNVLHQLQSVVSKLNNIASTEDSFAALEYLKNAVSHIEFDNSIASTEIISSFTEREQHTSDVTLNQSAHFIPTGFEELDSDIVGFQRGDELIVLYARTNQGKSWVSEKIATYMVEQGYRVGYFSPEMNELDIGYRFDTLHGHISNNAMRLGRFSDEFTLNDYSEYGNTLKDISGKLFVTRPKTFNRKVTVSRLKQWIKSDKLDALFIDGITYLTDERFKRGDSKTISLTNISEDLMELSSEMRVPIIVVVQANRGGVVDKHSLDTPELENIRDSDGIAQNASIVYAIRQVKTKSGETILILDNKKMRGGEVGKSYKYRWIINTGEFETVQDSDIQLDKDSDEAPIREKKSPTSGRRAKREKAVEDDY